MKFLRILFQIIFSQLTLVILSLIFQILIIVFFLCFFSRYIIILLLISFVLSLIFSLYILNKNKNTSYKIAWLCLLFFLPIFGVVFYLLTHVPFMEKKISKKISEIHSSVTKYNSSSLDTKLLQCNSDKDNSFFYYMNSFCDYPIYQFTKTEYFSNGVNFFNDLISQIKKSEKYIFLEYFIIEYGSMWDILLNVLREKVNEGVEVRILYDGIGSIALYADHFSKKMEQYGILCKVFFPVKPIFSLYQNHRDHRKLCIIDGKIAYTGGINIGDDYINEKKRFGYWKDSGIKLIGPAVDRFTLLFLEMWNLNEKDHDSYEVYLFGNTVKQNDKIGIVLPYGDCPFDDEEVSKNVYLHILHTANKFVHIMTPYLVLDHEFLNTLIFTAKRGVKIKIIMPYIPDKKLVNLLSKSYYKELLENGIEVFEYSPGFCHAKIFSSDYERGVVGTINLDYRSLYLNFECGVFLYRDPVIHDIEQDFHDSLKKCRKITISDIGNYPFYKKMLGKVLRLFSPLL